MTYLLASLGINPPNVGIRNCIISVITQLDLSLITSIAYIVDMKRSCSEASIIDAVRSIGSLILMARPNNM